MNNCYNKKGFNLVEMIAASIILSLAVVSICAIHTKSITAVKSNRNYELAWDLLDRQLTMIDYIGIKEFINEGRLSGRFDTEHEGICHHWQAKYQQEDYDNLYKLKLAVSWTEGSRQRTISAAVMLNGSGILAETDKTEETEESRNNSQSGGQNSGGDK